MKPPTHSFSRTHFVTRLLLTPLPPLWFNTNLGQSFGVLLGIIYKTPTPTSQVLGTQQLGNVQQSNKTGEVEDMKAQQRHFSPKKQHEIRLREMKRYTKPWEKEPQSKPRKEKRGRRHEIHDIDVLELGH